VTPPVLAVKTLDPPVPPEAMAPPDPLPPVPEAPGEELEHPTIPNKEMATIEQETVAIRTVENVRAIDEIAFVLSLCQTNRQPSGIGYGYTPEAGLMRLSPRGRPTCDRVASRRSCHSPHLHRRVHLAPGAGEVAGDAGLAVA